MSPGQAAFEAYNLEKGGVTYDGKKIPPWTDVGDEVRGAWEAAASAVIFWTVEQTQAGDVVSFLRATLRGSLSLLAKAEPGARGRELALVRTKLEEAGHWLAAAQEKP